MKTNRAKCARLRRSGWRVPCALLFAGACGGTVIRSPSVGSESHFLAHCETSCDGGLDCIAGICTRPCLTQQASCTDLAPGAACTNQSVEPGEVAVCDVSCGAAARCGALGDDYACESGYCRKARGAANNGDPGTAGAATGDQCDAFRDQSPPPDGRAISITNTGSVPLYILGQGGCQRTNSLLQVERGTEFVDVFTPPDCWRSCQQLMDEGWPYAPGTTAPVCPDSLCLRPRLVLIEAGQTLVQSANLENVQHEIPSSCVQGLTTDSESCYTRVIPAFGPSYTLTVQAVSSLECSGGQPCECVPDANGICTNPDIGVEGITPFVFSFPSTWYFQNQDIQIAAPGN